MFKIVGWTLKEGVLFLDYEYSLMKGMHILHMDTYIYR